MEGNILVKAKKEDLENIDFIKQYFLDFQGVDLQNATIIKRALKELRLRMEKEYQDDIQWHKENKYDCNNLYIDIEYKDEFLVGFKLDARNKVPTVFYIIEELLNRIKKCRYKNEYKNAIKKYMNVLLAIEFESIEEFEQDEEDDFDQGFSIGKIIIELDKNTFQYINCGLLICEKEIIDMYGEMFLDNFTILDYDICDEFSFDKINEIIQDIKFINVGYKHNNNYYLIIK